ncbi:putative venom acid phosphatase Acph-1-like [Sesbania bispinosa]|nr:putative venom acid phosphatase Acph-1-like [Sesbania bispinosa]
MKERVENGSGDEKSMIPEERPPYRIHIANEITNKLTRFEALMRRIGDWD